MDFRATTLNANWDDPQRWVVSGDAYRPISYNQHNEYFDVIQHVYALEKRVFTLEEEIKALSLALHFSEESFANLLEGES